MPVVWKNHPGNKPKLAKRHGRFLKSLEHGRIFMWTPILAKRTDMGECDEKGAFLRKADARRDVSDLTFVEKVMATRTEDEMIDMAARFDMAFSQGMTAQQMQKGFLRELGRMQAEGQLPASLERDDFSDYYDGEEPGPDASDEKPETDNEE